MAKQSTKIAIVTGGASGIGKAVCIKLFEESHHVVVCDKNLKAAKSMAVGASKADTEMLPQYLDVSNSRRVKAVFEKIFERYGRIDILVNCAGITQPPTPLVELKDPDFKKLVDVHLMGTFYCMREGATYMVKKNFGRIVNISSRAGVFGLYGKSHYSAAKAGIIGLSLTAAKELYDKGITVNVIAPGSIRTPMSSAPTTKKRSPRARQDLVVGEPEDVANLVYFLTKEESSLINGSVFILDAGGYLWHEADDRFMRQIKA